MVDIGDLGLVGIQIEHVSGSVGIVAGTGTSNDIVSKTDGRFASLWMRRRM